MDKKIANRIKNVMSAVFEVPVDNISNISSSDTIESWDSLKHMNLIIALEEEFNIIIPDNEVGNLLTFGLILYTINEVISYS